MTVLPENILRLMRPEDRAALGPGNQTASEAQHAWQRAEEGKMHSKFMEWLNLNEIPFAHSTFGRKSTLTPGWPDFTVTAKNKIVLIEFKSPGAKLTGDQKEVIPKIEKTGTPVLVTESVAEAIRITKREIGI